MNAVLVIADGMADRPMKELGWKTPLEAAHKPSLNQIARTGICGILDPIAPGIPAGSDVATLALLGYDSVQAYSGRGALEAIGSGTKILPDDVTFRCNFATVNEKGIITDRRAGRIANEEARRLASALQQIKLKKPSNVRFLFKGTIQHRTVFSLRGPKLSTAVSDSDPGKIGEKPQEIKPLDDSTEAKLTARIVNDLLRDFHEALKNHPLNKERERRGLPQANIVLCRGAGTIPNIRPLSEIYGIKATCIAAAPLVKGVCKAAGMKVTEVKGATGTLQTDYMAKARAAVQALKTSDFVLLHVKATDVASHDKNPKEKVGTIEKVDGILDYMLDHTDSDDTYIAVTADHTTSTLTGNHEGDPVPIAITGPYVRRDDVTEYGERTCAKGGLNRIKGKDLMPTLMNLIGKTQKFGT